MTLHLLSIPEQPSALSTWLEAQLVGLYLTDLVDELSVVREREGENKSIPLADLLTPADIQNVSSSGLGSLDEDQLIQLLVNPQCLLELQEHVLEKESSFWSHVTRSDEHLGAIQRVETNLRSAIEQPGIEAALTPSISGRKVDRRLLGILLMATVFVFAIGLWMQKPLPSGRVLGLPGLTVNNVASSTEYLNRIADAGQTWFDSPATNKDELIVSLREVSSDCQILIDAQHEALTTGEQKWFVAKCENWKTKFDQTLTSLEQDTISFAEAQTQADAIMQKLVNVVRAGPDV